MAKRYLSLDEAASQIGLTSEQLMKLRERNEIRGFADRGSWKFREQDVEEFLRSQQADSSPDIPIIRDGSSSVLDEPEAADLSSSDSDVRLYFDDSLFDKDDAKSLAESGSDVRLSGDSGPKLEAESEDDDALGLSGWASDVKISDSDSDVKLVGAGTAAEIDLSKTSKMSDSDSDVLLADDSDSDVRLSDGDDLGKTGAMNLADHDSDSDVKLMGSEGLFDEDSDSDVKLSIGLDRTDSDIRLAEHSPAPNAKSKSLPIVPDDSDLKLIKKGSGVRQPAPDSGIGRKPRGSGISLDADESGISLEMDSGISLDADDSGINLESFDSGASLGDDSGISLDAGDSGISLDIDDDSGISMQPDDLSRTMPMQAIPAAKAMLADSSAMTTQFDIPTKPVGKESEFELAGLDDDDDDTGSNTSVLTFEDDNVDSSKTVMTKAVSDFDAEEEVDNEVYSDDDGDDEDHEDLDDVHDAEDFADDDDFEGGKSEVDGFPTGARVSSRVDADWGILTKSLIGVSTVLSILCAVVGIELVRTMWLWTQPGSEASQSKLLQMFGGLFG